MQVCDQPKLRIKLKIAIDFASVTESASAQIAFENTFKEEMAAALGISRSWIVIVSLTPGSVDVKFDVIVPENSLGNSSGTGNNDKGAAPSVTLENLQKDLLRQVGDPTSKMNTQGTYVRLSKGTPTVDVIRETGDGGNEEKDNDGEPLDTEDGTFPLEGVLIPVGFVFLAFAAYCYHKKKSRSHHQLPKTKLTSNPMQSNPMSKAADEGLQLKVLQPSPASENSKATSSLTDPVRETWKRYVDEKSGRFYYHNSDTNETTWDEPEGALIL